MCLQGLPLAVTISLAFSMRKMIADAVLVRELSSCETMGSATAIASDKTGTLTENRMTVVGGYFFGETCEDTLAAAGSASPPAVFTDAAAKSLLTTTLALNSDAQLAISAGDQGGDKVEFIGNKTEGALLLMGLRQCGLDYSAIRTAASSAASKGASTSAPFFCYRENFSSSRKRMSTILTPEVAAALVKAGVLPAYAAAGGAYLVLCKGAAEMVLELCTHVQLPGADGRSEPITTDRRAQLNESIVSFASAGLRTLAIAFRRLPVSDMPPALAELLRGAAAGGAVAPGELDAAWAAAVESGIVESDLSLLAITGIKDPLRAGVKESVASCKAAGIKVRMVTGDNLLTARQIAKECGIFNGGVVLEGSQWREMTQPQRLAVTPRLEVLARAIPTDKLMLVETLKELGETVAVTGDGTNDAPALRAAHIGCAMGIAGTEVSKEAAKMIILDDRFNSIVTAVLWGRSVLESVRKFLSFQLAINVGSCTITLVLACLEGGSPTNFPLTPVQLLWINLIMDSFAALALATEPPRKQLLQRKPTGRHTPLVTAVMNKMIIGHAIFQVALVLGLTLTTGGAAIFMVGRPDAGVAGAAEAFLGTREHLTAIFNTYVFLQLWNKMNARRIDDGMDIWSGFFDSPYGPGMIALIIALQAIIVQEGGVVMQTVPLNVEQWFLCIAIGAASIPVGYLLRFIPTRDTDAEAAEKHSKKHSVVTVAVGGKAGDAEAETVKEAAVGLVDVPHLHKGERIANEAGEAISPHSPSPSASAASTPLSTPAAAAGGGSRISVP